jgi:PAS domain S-box-containing protein
VADLNHSAEALTQPFHLAAEALGLGMPYRMLVESDRSTRRFVHVGESCLALNGVSPDAVLADGGVLYRMILPEHRSVFEAAETAALSQRRSFEIEVQMRRADGEVRWHRIASYPRPLPDGRTLWEGLQTDITERRRLADELADQRRRLQMAVEATGLGFWEWDPRYAMVLWSDRNRDLFGLPAGAEVDINRYMSMIHPEDLSRVQEAYRQTADAEEGGDFSIEHRIVRPDGEVRWLLVHGRVVKEDGEPNLVVGTSIDVTDRKAAEERRSLLMGELAHRAKNGLTVMMAIVGQTARSATTVPEFEAALMSRLQAMSQSQDLVTATGGLPVQLSGVIERVLSPFGAGRFDVAAEFEEVTIAAPMATALGLLLHELATNAVKYGALSSGAGRVRIAPAAAAERRVAFRWSEAGGPSVSEPTRKGFGTRVLQTALAPFGGRVECAYDPAGFQAHVEFPPAG